MIDGNSRAFVDPEGVTFHVQITPREIPSGVSRRVNSITFTTEEGEWVGSAPIHAASTLDDLTDFQLLSLLQEARLRG